MEQKPDLTPETSNTPITLTDVEAVGKLSSSQKTELIAYHREQLKLLHSVPRSDWHKALEDVMGLDFDSWGNGTWLIREYTLGEDAPRIDFIVFPENGVPEDAKPIYKFFKRNNAIEFKGPGDRLTRLTVRKVVGYVNLYIATANKEENVTEENVTASIIASERNEKQFSEMLDSGILEKTDIPGIYVVKKLTDIPFHVVMINELDKKTYAAYRILQKHAGIEDVETLLGYLKIARKDDDQNTSDRLHRILNLVEIKNPGAVAEFIREDETMKSIFLDVLKPEIDKEIHTAVDNTTRTNLYLYVQDGGMTIDYAARRAGISTDQFRTEMTAHGYHLPQAQTV